MTWQHRFQTGKARFLANPQICAENRALFAEFFAFEEYKLKRLRGLRELDEGCCNTLYCYIHKLGTVNAWFDNKPWKDLNRDDIKRVYDALEDGTIRNRRGRPYANLPSFYNKVMKSKPFRLAGKADLVREVIEFSVSTNRTVRYLTEESFRSLVSVVGKPKQLLLLWLAWDIGENINSLLRLTKRDFLPQRNRDTGDLEYVVNLPESVLKRSRQSRGEVTLYPETARYVEIVLRTMADHDRVFTCGYRAASKLLGCLVRRSGATTMPNGDPVRWKDFRSGMACHLLRAGWSRDEVNARLGHTPHSSALDAYINFLAIDRARAKSRLQMGTTRGAPSVQRPDQAFGPAEGKHPAPRVDHDALRILHEEVERLRKQIAGALNSRQSNVAFRRASR